MRVFTTHGTVLFVDLTTNELRHGSPPTSPPNVKIVLQGPNAQIVHSASGTLRPIAFSVDYSRSIAEAAGADTAPTPTLFEVIQLDQARVALRAQGVYLSAERDGRITLAREKCLGWESFTLCEESPNQTTKIAAFTTVYNDRTFLPIWLRYYGQALSGEQNLFVLDHGSNDGSTANLGFANRIRVPREQFDEDQRSTFVRLFQASLLCYFDVVIFSDPDEILIADPEKFSGLGDFINQRCEQFVTAIGVDVQHLPDSEGEIDLNLPILSQRRYVRFAADYCKTLISRIPLVWRPGFHSCNYNPSIDRNLFLFHLKTIDRNVSLELLKKTRSYSWSERALKGRQAVQARMEDDEFVRKFFPFSSETIKSVPQAGFDFSDDLRRFITDRPNVSQFFKGGVAVIPEKFRNAIRGALAPANTHVSDGAMPDSVGRIGAAAATNRPFVSMQNGELLEKVFRFDAA
jgi:hypothetical protein